jgi:hypothetical protein
MSQQWQQLKHVNAEVNQFPSGLVSLSPFYMASFMLIKL